MPLRRGIASSEIVIGPSPMQKKLGRSTGTLSLRRSLRAIKRTAAGKLPQVARSRKLSGPSWKVRGNLRCYIETSKLRSVAVSQRAAPVKILWVFDTGRPPAGGPTPCSAPLQRDLSPTALLGWVRLGSDSVSHVFWLLFSPLLLSSELISFFSACWDMSLQKARRETNWPRSRSRVSLWRHMAAHGLRMAEPPSTALHRALQKMPNHVTVDIVGCRCCSDSGTRRTHAWCALSGMHCARQRLSMLFGGSRSPSSTSGSGGCLGSARLHPHLQGRLAGECALPPSPPEVNPLYNQNPRFTTRIPTLQPQALFPV